MIRCIGCNMPHSGAGRWHPQCKARFDETHPTLFDAPKVSAVRKTDPRPSKVAAAKDADYRMTQTTRLLRFMYDHGPITADLAYRELPYDGEDVDRGEWSARLGVLCSGVYPLAEKAGEVPDRNRKGKVRDVMSYRLTMWGRAEVETMLGRAS